MKHVLAVILLAASCVAQSNKNLASETGKVNQGGRYQIVMWQGESPRINTFLLDTVTGKTWLMVSLPDGMSFWEPVLRADNDAEEAALMRKHPAPAK
ncbi:MAG: hypothetical protein WBD25_13970 [Terriglobales bacterium]